MGKLIPLLLIAGFVWFWWQGRRARTPSMPLSEARALLGIDETADPEAIRAAHRRIILRVHPDAGGTPDLARRTNLARDLLLRDLERRPPAPR